MRRGQQLLLVVVACLVLLALLRRSPDPSSSRHSDGEQHNPERAKQAVDRRQLAAQLQAHTLSGPRLYVITPTFPRPSQKADLTRLSHTLFAASFSVPIHWIVIEDHPFRTNVVQGVLTRSLLPHTHLNDKEEHIPHHFKGGNARNQGIKYVRNLDPPPHLDSVIYFADDDNAYDVRVFQEAFSVKRIGVWPVGFSGGRRAEYPVVANGVVTGFESYLSDSRNFPLDMAGFALNVKYFLRTEPLLFVVNAPRTKGETMFLEATGEPLSALEPKASNCTEVLVWHVKTAVFVDAKYEHNAPHISEV